jgi:folylpolyglutamate synthase/dihydropteroate synthase
VLGTTRAAIAAEKLPSSSPARTVVLTEPEWEGLAVENGAAQVVVAEAGNLAVAMAAAEAYLGRPVDGHVEVSLPGRAERVSDHPLEDLGRRPQPRRVGYILARLPSARYTLVASILADKDVEGMLAALSRSATASSRRGRAARGRCRPPTSPSEPAATSPRSRRSRTLPRRWRRPGDRRAGARHWLPLPAGRSRQG